jgi:hypothetical protein
LTADCADGADEGKAKSVLSATSVKSAVLRFLVAATPRRDISVIRGSIFFSDDVRDAFIGSSFAFSSAFYATAALNPFVR